MTHMHFRTHTKPESLGQSGRWQSPYHDTMIDHDRNVGQLLDLVDELGIAEDTIVIYSTDNGPHANSWPDGATTPFRSEKATNWEGAFRIPEMIRWTGKIKPGSVSNEIVQHHDWLPTFLAAAGDPDIVEKLKKGHKAGDMKYKVHIDGYNLLPYLTGEVDKSPRRGMIYFSDDGDVLGIRAENWKIVVHGAALPRHPAGLVRTVHPAASAEVVQPADRPVRACRCHVEHLLGLGDRPHLISMFYGSAIVNQFLETFKEFPPRQEPASFTINHAVEELEQVPRQSRAAERGGTRNLERRAHEVGDRRLRGPGDHRGWTGLRRARSACRRVRQRRHAVVREADVHPARLHRAPAAPRRPPPMRRWPEQQPYKAAVERRPEWFGGADHQALPG